MLQEQGVLWGFRMRGGDRGVRLRGRGSESDSMSLNPNLKEASLHLCLSINSLGCRVQCLHRIRQLQACVSFWICENEGGYTFWHQLRMANCDFFLLFSCETSILRRFCNAQCGWNSNTRYPFSSSFMDLVCNCFGAVDWRTAANRDQNISSRRFDKFGGFSNSSNWSKATSISE